MSNVGGRAWNRLLVAAALALGHGLVAAAPDAAGGGEGGISGAKRDYQTLKAPAETAERPKIDLPPAPTLELKTEAAVPTTTTVRGRKLTEEERLRELQREKETSRNWLIEAMAKQEQPAAAATTSTVPLTEPNAELDRAAKLMALLDAIAAKSAGNRPSGEPTAADLKDSPTVLNPLDRYMTSWMTSADFKLLGPKPDSGATIGGTELFRPAVNTTDPRAAPPFADLSAGLDRGAAGAENPYLRELAPLAPVPANLADLAPPPAVLPPNPLASLVAPAARAEPPPPPSFSEQLKAQDDAKYFKQLKRF